MLPWVTRAMTRRLAGGQGGARCRDEEPRALPTLTRSFPYAVAGAQPSAPLTTGDRRDDLRAHQVRSETRWLVPGVPEVQIISSLVEAGRPRQHSSSGLTDQAACPAVPVLSLFACGSTLWRGWEGRTEDRSGEGRGW